MRFRNLKANVTEDVSNALVIKMMQEHPETYQPLPEKQKKTKKAK